MSESVSTLHLIVQLVFCSELAMTGIRTPVLSVTSLVIYR